MATIKDVAKEANVSIGTVSNVINGKTNNEELIRRADFSAYENRSGWNDYYDRKFE